jgi:ATP-dependent DNA helicase RecQ
MANEDFSGVWHLRETRALVNWLRGREPGLVKSADLNGRLGKQLSGPWIELLQEAITEYELETSGAETSVDYFIEWLAEWGREVRRRQRGLLLLTAHRAKGLEFEHVVVLDGGWDRVGRGEDADAPRRLYYVAMTRARQTLGLARFPGSHPLQDALPDSPSILHRAPIEVPRAAPELTRRYRRLSLRDVFLSFAGYRPSGHPLHRAISALSPGDLLQVRVKANRWELQDRNGTVVGRLAGGFEAPAGMRCAFATVLAIATWDRERSEPEYRDGPQCDTWEVVVPELVFGPDS